MPGRAFTLIELLVVITIIVVLLSLLTPALDKAIYQAELTQCGAGLKAIGTGVLTYAFEHRRSYPERPGIRDDGEMPVYAWRPNTINDSVSHDERPILGGFLSLNKNLNCPLNADVDFERSPSTTIIEADYNLWFGFRFPGTGGMQKLGQKITWDGQKFGVLADDYDMLNVQANDDHATHFDYDGVMQQVTMQDSGVGLVWTLSRWATNGVTYRRGPMDRNFAYDDGSVLRLTELVIHEDGTQDDRLAVLPPFAESSDTSGHKNSLPRQ